MKEKNIKSLKKQQEFNEISSSGLKAKSRFFIIILLKKQDDLALEKKEYFLGQKVSKKLGNSVIRNLIKRRVRHVFRETIKFHNTPFSCIVIPNKLTASEPFIAILENFSKTIFYLMNKA